MISLSSTTRRAPTSRRPPSSWQRSRFVLARDRKRPLKIGIHRDLTAAIPEVPPKRLRAALGWYAGNWAYLKNMTAGAARIDLNGQSAGEVTAEEAAAAAERRASEKAAYFVAKKAARERK